MDEFIPKGKIDYSHEELFRDFALVIKGAKIYNREGRVWKQSEFNMKFNIIGFEIGGKKVSASKYFCTRGNTVQAYETEINAIKPFFTVTDDKLNLYKPENVTFKDLYLVWPLVHTIHTLGGQIMKISDPNKCHELLYGTDENGTAHPWLENGKAKYNKDLSIRGFEFAHIPDVIIRKWSINHTPHNHKNIQY